MKKLVYLLIWLLTIAIGYIIHLEWRMRNVPNNIQNYNLPNPNNILGVSKQAQILPEEAVSMQADPSSKIEFKRPEQEYLNMAIALIKKYEGLKLTVYRDSKTNGKPYTVGYGSTRDEYGREWKLGQTISKEQAEKLLYTQLTKIYLPQIKKVPFWDSMQDGMKASLVSFGYNLGKDFYGNKKFNAITKVLTQKDWAKVPDVLYLYRNPKSNVEKGLAKRRLEEGLLWKTALIKI